MRRTPFPGLLSALVLLTTLSAAAFVHIHKQVRLVVDGQVRTVDTFSPRVADLLAEEGLPVDRYDVVTPGLAASLDDGMEIEVLLAKEVVLLVDGLERTVHVTGDNTVADVLEQVNVRASRQAYLDPSRGATVEAGDVIVYRPAVSVRLHADGRVRDVVTNAETVGALLERLGLTLDQDDRVEPGTSAPVVQDLDIRVTRVTFEQVTEDQPIPFDTEVRRTGDLMLGIRRVEQEGAAGILRRAFRVRLENGKQVARMLVGSEVAREPRTEIVLEGTRPPHTQTGVASWYRRTGLVAAHQSLPFGTQVKVTNVATGRSVVVVINDRGPYLGERIIDLSDDAYAQLAPLSTGTIHVRISW